MTSPHGAQERASLLEAVAEAARCAGTVALAAWRTGLAIEAKADGSPVTQADLAAERAAREWIESRFPEDGILGEEFGLVRPDAARRWLVDPIDGTKTFVRGVPLWGSLVAIAEGERVIAGAACFPAVGESLAAAAGLGCFLNGARCAVSSVSRIEDATLLITDDRFPKAPERERAWRALAARAAVTRTWGDCYGYLLVCAGRAEAMADAALSAWDAAPVQILVEEAGGVFTDWRGARTAFGADAIATNAALADTVREALGARPPRTT